ncbi:MAG: hypothetical protein E6I38_10440, partial [Chloroflexi bacterium]
NLGDPPGTVTNWAVQGYPFQSFAYAVKNVSGVKTIEDVMFQNPPEVCGMTTLDLTFQGVSTDNPDTLESEGGRNILTNPPTNAIYTWNVELKSHPLSDPGVHTVTRCDQINVGGTAPTDTDADGIANTCDNCPTISNANQLNWDQDSLGDRLLAVAGRPGPRRKMRPGQIVAELVHGLRQLPDYIQPHAGERRPSSDYHR